MSEFVYTSSAPWRVSVPAATSQRAKDHDTRQGLKSAIVVDLIGTNVKRALDVVTDPFARTVKTGRVSLDAEDFKSAIVDPIAAFMAANEGATPADGLRAVLAAPIVLSSSRTASASAVADSTDRLLAILNASLGIPATPAVVAAEAEAIAPETPETPETEPTAAVATRRR